MHANAHFVRAQALATRSVSGSALLGQARVKCMNKRPLSRSLGWIAWGPSTPAHRCRPRLRPVADAPAPGSNQPAQPRSEGKAKLEPLPPGLLTSSMNESDRPSSSASSSKDKSGTGGSKSMQDGAGGASAGASNSSSNGSSNTQPTASAAPSASPAAPTVFSLKPVYILLFVLIFLGGALFAAVSMQLTSGVGFQDAITMVVRRIFRSIAFRQLVVIAVAIFLVRFALNSVLRLLAAWSSSPVAWDKTRIYYVMKEVYSPLELLLFIAGCCTIADSFVPQLINVPKATVNHVVRVILSSSFVLGAATVMYNLKSRFCKEQAWQCEMQGDVTSQRRWEAYDKLGTFAIYAVSVIVGIQALGLEVRSVLAIGGIGGLAIGLAGREICENILNGFLIMTTVPFEVGDEVLFRPNSSQVVEGIVVDVGWYRTLIRSFEREMYVIPNSVFSKNTVLNVTRKAKEWRFYEYLLVRVQDVQKVNAIIQDIRRIVRNDARIINKLHRRVFLDKIDASDVKIYISFYVEASNRDAFMAVKQDLLLAFVDCVERNGAKLAQPRTVLEMDDSMVNATKLFGMGMGMAKSGMNPYGGPNVVEVLALPAGAGEAGPSSNGSSGGGGGAKSSKSSSKDGAGSSGQQAPDGSKPAGDQQQASTSGQQQQQQQQQQPALAYAGGGSTRSTGTQTSTGGRFWSGVKRFVRDMFAADVQQRPP